MRRRAFVLVNRFANRVVRALGLTRFRGGDLLYLTTTGRKSGKPGPRHCSTSTTANRWVVVASNGGADWEPGWWLNLRAGSDGAVEVQGRTVVVVGKELAGQEREPLWRRLNDEVFDYEGYQRKVSRQLAVVALVPA